MCPGFEAAELVERGTRTINGKTQDATFYNVTKSTLREVSVIAVGANKSTHMQVMVFDERKASMGING